MDKETYKELLKKANLSKKELASLLGCATQTVNNWGSTNKVPYWLESWLSNYIKAKNYNDVKDTVFKVEGIEKG